MSEPYAAFVKLRIARPSLIRWLDARPQPASRWHDWREIGGRWYIGKGTPDIRDIPESDLAGTVADSDQQMAGTASNRAAIKNLVSGTDPPVAKRISYDAATHDFIAGTLFFSENLADIIQALAFIRGAADALGPDEYGIAVIHDYVFGRGDDPDATVAAIRLEPNGASSFLNATEKQAAAGVFQPVADEMTSLPETAPAIDQLDMLR